MFYIVYSPFRLLSERDRRFDTRLRLWIDVQQAISDEELGLFP